MVTVLVMHISGVNSEICRKQADAVMQKSSPLIVLWLSTADICISFLTCVIGCGQRSPMQAAIKTKGISGGNTLDF